MKKCNYCGSVRPDELELCCGLNEFTPIVEETKEELFEVQSLDEKCDDQEPDNEELVVQPAAHELLVELVELIDIDEIIEECDYPQWIEDIPYDDLRTQAKNRWFIEHPGVVARVKKYLGL